MRFTITMFILAICMAIFGFGFYGDKDIATLFKIMFFISLVLFVGGILFTDTSDRNRRL